MKQPWIVCRTADGAFILAPALIITVALLCLHPVIATAETLPPWLWGLLIVGVDVAHVYATLFRTYADRQEFRARRALYTLTPLLCWMVGTLLYRLDALLFWRAIAYLAVFHFIRQQYGFMMLYARRESMHPPLFRLTDKAAIYLATIYPLIYWHTHMPRRFDWFVEGDFFPLSAPLLDQAALVSYVSVLLAYVAKESWVTLRSRALNIPKNALLITTAASWWTGIITFDSDLAFTAANVVAHGIPYTALVWIYGRNQGRMEPGHTLFGVLKSPRFFTLSMLPVFIGLLVTLAYLEEGLWDGLVWREHARLFSPFRFLPLIEDKETLALLVPMLALPQLTHYALDGFIWRLQTPDTDWKRILLYREQAA